MHSKKLGSSSLNPLEKKVPRNPKYAKVKGNLDTGATVNKVRSVSTKEFLRRQNEVFQRIRPRELQAAIGCISEESEEEEGSEECSKALTQSHPRESFESKHGNQQESSQGKRGPIGDFDADTSLDIAKARREREKDLRRNVLLLDVREAGEFRECHIQGAVSYPVININQDRFTAAMHRVRNQPGHEIVVYDEDERVACVAATGLVQRGFENVRLLSGGLKAFGNMFPHMISSPLPERLVKQESLSPTSSTTSSRREERRRRRELTTGDLSPRELFSSGASGFSSSSAISHKSTFSRAPRWRDDAGQRHKEILAKLHHNPN